MSHIDPDAHAQWLADTMNATIFSPPGAAGAARANGGFVHSCARHCGAELLTIDGFTVPTALETFMASGGGGGGSSPRALFLDHQPSGCKACCNDVAVPPLLGFASE